MFTPIAGRTVLITGGTKGIGKGIARSGATRPHEDLLALDFDTICPLAGHIHFAGAEPGDVLAVSSLT